MFTNIIDYIYSKEGVYVVTLEVKDYDGETSQFQDQIHIFAQQTDNEKEGPKPNKTIIWVVVAILFLSSFIFLVKGIKKSNRV